MHLWRVHDCSSNKYQRTWSLEILSRLTGGYGLAEREDTPAHTDDIFSQPTHTDGGPNRHRMDVRYDAYFLNPRRKGWTIPSITVWDTWGSQTLPSAGLTPLLSLLNPTVLPSCTRWILRLLAWIKDASNQKPPTHLVTRSEDPENHPTGVVQNRSQIDLWSDARYSGCNVTVIHINTHRTTAYSTPVQWTRRFLFHCFQVSRTYSTTSVRETVKKWTFGSVLLVFDMEAVEASHFVQLQSLYSTSTYNIMDLESLHLNL